MTPRPPRQRGGVPLVVRRWLDAHWSSVVALVLGLSLALTVLLIIEAQPYGYVWDFYQEGVALLYREHRLPIAADCWECYQPPVYYLVGWPFFALGKWLDPANDDLAWRLLGGLSLLSAAVIVYYGARLLRLAGCRRGAYAAGIAVLCSVPVLFISANGPEADVVVAAFLAGCLFHLTRVFGRPGVLRTRDAFGLGLLAGLAAATKFSGLVALLAAGVLIVIRLIAQPARWQTVRAGGIILLTAVVVGGWKYVDNYQRYGTPLYANGSAARGLAVRGVANPHGYSFTTFRLSALRPLFGSRSVDGQLTTFPVYRSVLTTLHAQAWSDMSLFTVRGRHGATNMPYPTRNVPVTLTMTVIVLGLVPEVLAVMGIVIGLRHALLRPILVFTLLSVAVYVYWFLPQPAWALKTKYLLALLPGLVVFAMIGQAWLMRRLPWLAVGTSVLLAALVIVAHLYMLSFATARASKGTGIPVPTHPSPVPAPTLLERSGG